MSFDPIYPYDLPALPPKVNLLDSEIMAELVAARSLLGELKGFSDSLPNPLLLLSPAIVKESVASSEIENISTTLLDALENELFSEDERQIPDKEVLRYRDAILWGFANLQSMAVSTRLIHGIHKTLLPQYGGGYRQQQNGLEDKKTKKIVYTPPVQAKINECMNNLENFINKKNGLQIDPLIRSIIAHYQFEAIHPFGDGNGRTGRIMMVLGLVNDGLLDLPILYISGYINDNKNEYYKCLLEVTSKNNWKEYILFMLRGFTSQAKITREYIFKIKTSFFAMKERLKKENPRLYSSDVVEALFSNPILTPTKLADIKGCHYTTASKHLKALEGMGILVNKKVGRHQMYINRGLIELLH